MPTNKERADRITAALASYPGDRERARENKARMVDFLADLRHYCHQNYIDFEDCLRTAEGHFNEEV
jgi:uncharacterized protein YqiB (DUF1249 family)